MPREIGGPPSLPKIAVATAAVLAAAKLLLHRTAIRQYGYILLKLYI